MPDEREPTTMQDVDQNEQDMQAGFDEGARREEGAPEGEPAPDAAADVKPGDKDAAGADGAPAPDAGDAPLPDGDAKGDDKGKDKGAGKAKGDDKAKADGEPPASIEDKAKAAARQASAEQWWKDLKADHPDADEAMKSDWLRKWYDQATPAQRKLVEQGASAADVSRGLYAAKQWQAGQAAADKASGDRPASVLDAIKDQEITTRNGEKVSVSKMIEQFGDEGADIIDFIGGVVGLLKGELDAAKAEIAELKTGRATDSASLADLRFWESVRRQHNDVDALRAAGDVDKWVGEKGPGWARLWSEGTDKDVADVLTAYKQERIEGETRKAKDEMRVARDKRVQTERGFLGASNRQRATDPGDAIDEMKRGFMEGVKGE